MQDASQDPRVLPDDKLPPGLHLALLPAARQAPPPEKESRTDAAVSGLQTSPRENAISKSGTEPGTYGPCQRQSGDTRCQAQVGACQTEENELKKGVIQKCRPVVRVVRLVRE